MWFIVYFFIFWFIFIFFKDVLRQVSAVFPAMIYVWFWRLKENLSKLLDRLVFSNSLSQHIIVAYQQVGYLQPLTCHVVNYFNARPYIGNETETCIRVMVCAESDEKSVRNPNDVSISPCAFKNVQGANSLKYIIIKEI